MAVFSKTIFSCSFALLFGWWEAGSATQSTGLPFSPDTAMPDTSNKPSESFMYSLLEKYPQYFDTILRRKNELNVQVIYTQIDRTKKGGVNFTDHFFNHRPPDYFYPASTVKFPIAILALQKLKELNIPGLDRNTTMITGTDGPVQTGVNNDPSAADGRPTIAHYIKKILLVSDNDAFNRLYEFLGQEYINASLHKMGYADAQIIHRLSISLSDADNRHTNPVKFIDSTGKVLYEQGAQKSRLVYTSRDTKLGNGYMRGETLVNEPFDFSRKNRLALTDLHKVMRSIIFPEAVPAKERFNITKDDYNFLRRYMSMRPPESRSPVYDPKEGFHDNYVKMLFYGTEKTTPDPGIRIFNKTGTAYGFLIETAYIVDFANKIEFLLSAVIYCNSDGIFNDDRYDYNTVGYPFLKHLGQVLYEHELKRQRKYVPDLSPFIFNYTE